ncbi:ArdC family protein [Bacillus wiedmannii]|uniref:ArdC family protein n=1 Tax=Bacillus wiedmannii TaxID=1890302 RepID=UPI0015D48CCD|nr:zincin-like metallopeptidase domain-containing protein [Bacillus wiedmannii]
MSKVYEYVQQKIIDAIEFAIEEGGTVPWRKPWKNGVPRNYITKDPYRGINLLLLDGGSYLTYKQLQDIRKKDKNIKLRKGAKQHPVYFWKVVDKSSDESEEENGTYFLFRYYKVYSVSDVEGIEEDYIANDNEAFETCENLIKAYKEEVPISVRVSDKAYYSPSSDMIVVPKLNQFESSIEHYSTVFHEMIHSTGHTTRLDRFDGKDSTIFGSESYSKEELVAEIGSNMLLAMFGLEDDRQHENSISYLHGWLTRIKEDPRLITSAAQKAQKAADFILHFAESTIKEEKEILVV